MQLTNCLLRLSPLVLTCHIGLACAQITTPSAGTYVRKGGGGDLVVRANGKFHIQTVGANGHTCELEGTITNGRARIANSACAVDFTPAGQRVGDRKSTRLNSSHSQISYAVFCLKKKKLTHDVNACTI